jgi:hypothetical protein
MKVWKYLLMACLLSGTSQAQDQPMTHKPSMKHAAEMTMNTVPEEGGQSAFAAIQEIVVLLEANPKTDWTKVNIEGLRQHLIDMNNVTLEAAAVATQTGSSVTFDVSGEGPLVASIQRMVIAHVKAMNGIDGWKFAAAETAKGVTIKVTPPNVASMTKLQALGFIGMLTRGMHHQEHHWMIATGKQPHG